MAIVFNVLFSIISYLINQKKQNTIGDDRITAKSISGIFIDSQSVEIISSLLTSVPFFHTFYSLTQILFLDSK